MIAVLAYHKVGAVPDGGWETWFRVPESMFAEHLAYLDGTAGALAGGPKID